MKIKSIVTYIFLFVCPFTTQSQTLEELLSLGKQNSLELEILEKEYSVAKEKVHQVGQLPDTEVGMGGFPLPVETRLGAQLVRYSITQMFPWPGVLDGKKELEQTKAKVLYERIATKELEQAYEVKLDYYRLYEIQQRQAIILRNITILQSLERLALTKVESGKSTAVDVLTVQLKVEELEEELKILERTKVYPTSSINQLLNRELDIPINITDSLVFVDLPFNKNELLTNITNSHPMLQMYEVQQEVSSQAISLNERDRRPSIGVGIDYLMVNGRNDAEPTNNGRDILQLRASMKIPLSQMPYEAKEREEQFKIEALELRKESVLKGFNAAIEKAYAKHEIAQLKAALYRKQIEITKAAIAILELDYSTSGAKFDELLRLEMELVDYDLKMLHAVVQSHIAKSEIERFIIQ